MNTDKKTRLRKLVKPRLQLELALTFAGLAGLALVFQFVLFTSIMSDMLTGLPGGFADHFELFSEAASRVLLVSLLVVLPLTALVGVFTSFRVVGPLHAIARFLERVRSGERPEDCKLRRDDEYHDLAELVNEITAPLRRGAADARGDGLEAASAPRAALPSAGPGAPASEARGRGRRG